jgi:hypothetical protein
MTTLTEISLFLSIFGTHSSYQNVTDIIDSITQVYVAEAKETRLPYAVPYKIHICIYIDIETQKTPEDKQRDEVE